MNNFLDFLAENYIWIAAGCAGLIAILLVVLFLMRGKKDKPVASKESDELAIKPEPVVENPAPVTSEVEEKTFVAPAVAEEVKENNFVSEVTNVEAVAEPAPEAPVVENTFVSPVENAAPVNAEPVVEAPAPEAPLEAPVAPQVTEPETSAENNDLETFGL